MKIAPATALAAWAVGTAWLVLFILLERVDQQGLGLVDWIEIVSGVVALAFYPLFRRLFAVWLDKTRAPS